MPYELTYELTYKLTYRATYIDTRTTVLYFRHKGKHLVNKLFKGFTELRKHIYLSHTQGIVLSANQGNIMYTIGTQYLSHGKHPNLCTISDILTTYNNAGAVVHIRYVATHTFLSQTVTETDIVAVTIARGIHRLEAA